jgi:hypothetical protein
MNDKKSSRVGRREFLRTLGVGTAAVAAGGPLVSDARADTETRSERTRHRYQPNSPHVQTFYRVNRYPAK